jgi:hypothetical protein
MLFLLFYNNPANNPQDGQETNALPPQNENEVNYAAIVRITPDRVL